MSDDRPFDDVLLHEKDIIITSARIEYDNTNYAMKYVSSVTLDEHHPPRFEAKLALATTLLALCVLIIYWFTDKVSGVGFTFAFLFILAALFITGGILFLAPSRFRLDMTLINGEKITIKSKNERKIHRIHNAVTNAVAMNRQDPYLNHRERSNSVDVSGNAHDARQDNPA